MNWHADESRVAVVLLSLSRVWHRVKSIPLYPSGDSVSNSRGSRLSDEHIGSP